MSESDIARNHANQLSKSLLPGVNFLRRLQKRMEKCGFPHYDKLYLLACDAFQASMKPWRLAEVTTVISANHMLQFGHGGEAVETLPLPPLPLPDARASIRPRR